MGVRHQHPARARHRRRRAVHRRRVAQRPRRTHRRRRRAAVGADHGPARLRAHRGAHLRLVDARHRSDDRRLDLVVRTVSGPLAFAVALVALVAFIAWGVRRQRRGESTLLAFGLFRIASFRNGNIAAVRSSRSASSASSSPCRSGCSSSSGSTPCSRPAAALARRRLVRGQRHRRCAERPRRPRLDRPRRSAGGDHRRRGSGVHDRRPDAAWGPLVPFLFVYGVGVGDSPPRS